MRERQMMAKTSRKNFAIFQKEFLRWAKILGLQHWKIYFAMEFLDGSFGECRTCLTGKSATIILNSELKEKRDIQLFDIKATAKHEALELLLAPLDINAKYRFVSKDEIDESRHAIIRTLENIL